MFTYKVDNPDKLFFTSDLHLNHYNICKYCNRPFSSRAEMNNALIENWNKVVPKDGIVVNCGDFILLHKESYYEYNKLAQKLNGRQILVRGNHDRVPLSINSIEISKMYVQKFIAIVDIANIEVNNELIVASHYPLLAYAANYNVFGHIHTLKDGTCHGIDTDVPMLLRTTQKDVGVDANNYTPISYNELMKYFKK